FGQGNPSFSLDSVWPGLAGFGSIWPNLDSAWIFLGCYTLHIGARDLIVSSPPAGRRPAAHESSSRRRLELSCEVALRKRGPRRMLQLATALPGAHTSLEAAS